MSSENSLAVYIRSQMGELKRRKMALEKEIRSVELAITNVKLQCPHVNSSYTESIREGNWWHRLKICGDCGHTAHDYDEAK